MRLRLTILTMISLMGSSCAHGASKESSEAGALSRGPYLAAGGADRMTIVWRGWGKQRPVVRIGSAPDQFGRIIQGPPITVRHAGGEGKTPLDSAPDGIVQYEATITGLQAATTYFFGVYDGDRLIAGADATYWFRTSPVTGSTDPFRFWVVGDSGTGDQVQADVHNAMRTIVQRDRTPLDLYLHLGDMAYASGSNVEFQCNFFVPYNVTLRNTVCWPTMGNHEGSSSSGPNGTGPYYDAYVLPTGGEFGGEASGTETYYSFNYANAHFICLNSFDIDRSPDAAMALWLKADLESANADWLIAYWHHPPYSKGSHDSDIDIESIEMRENFMPILEAGGVDVVFTGHSHTYERSMLMDGAYETPTVAQNFIFDDGDGDPDGDGAYRKSEGLHANKGTVQVVAGNGGVGVGRSGTMPVMKRVVVENGSVIVDIADDTLTAVMINAQGVQRDLFSIVKRGTVAPTRIAEPRQLPGYINWQAIEAVARLTTVVPPGVVTPLSIEIDAQSLPTPIPARITWQTDDTGWTVSPHAVEFTMTSGQVTRLTAEASYRDHLFPLATPLLFMQTDKGEMQGQGMIIVTAYKKTRIHRMSALPKIDGLLEELELAGLTQRDDMIEYNGKGPAEVGTEFYLGIYGNQLYIPIVNHEPEMNKLVLTDYERDGDVWADNCNEIFLQLEGEANYFQFVVGAGGHVFDAINDPTPGAAVWDSDFKSAVHRAADGWTTEVLIPLDMFEREVKAGDRLRVNITRNSPIHAELSQWSHTYQLGNHQPKFFGTAVIE